MYKYLIITGDVCDIRLKEGNMRSVRIWTEYCKIYGWEVNNWVGYKIFCRTWGLRLKWMGVDIADFSAKKSVEKYAGMPVTRAEIEKYLPYAEKKLSRIINLDGDLGGKRRQPRYLAAILGEIISGERFSGFCTDLCRRYKEADDIFFGKGNESVNCNIETLSCNRMIISQ